MARAKAEAYKSLDANRRRFAEKDENYADLAAAKEHIPQADTHARKAPDYYRRSEQPRSRDERAQ